MKKIFGLVFIVFALFSCKNTAENVTSRAVESDDDKYVVHKVAYYYAETNLPWVIYYYDVKDNDTIWVMEKWFHENGNLSLEGKIVDDQREGEFKGYYPSGQLMSVGSFVKGKREGKGKIFFESGKVNIENEYCDGKPCGIWSYFDEQGNLVDVKEF